MTVEQLQAFVVQQLKMQLDLLNFKPADITPEMDLFTAGLIDSMSFIELLGAIEAKFGVEMNLEEIDPEEVYSIEGMARHANQRS